MYLLITYSTLENVGTKSIQLLKLYPPKDYTVDASFVWKTTMYILHRNFQVFKENAKRTQTTEIRGKKALHSQLIVKDTTLSFFYSNSCPWKVRQMPLWSLELISTIIPTQFLCPNKISSILFISYEDFEGWTTAYRRSESGNWRVTNQGHRKKL